MDKYQLSFSYRAGAGIVCGRLDRASTHAPNQVSQYKIHLREGYADQSRDTRPILIPVYEQRDAFLISHTALL